MAKPHIVIHAAVSLDGLIDGFEPDLGAYYGLIETWSEDITLCGSETILAAAPPPDAPDAEAIPAPEPGDERPLLAVVDSRGRVRSWGGLIGAGHWRAGLAVCSAATPSDHLEYLERMDVEPLEAGAERVDLALAVERLAERGARTIRVDAGPTLNGLALRAGLVDEVSLLVHPAIAGAGRSFADRLDEAVKLTLTAGEERPGGLLWARYEVVSRG